MPRECCDDKYKLMDLTAANSLLFLLTVLLVSLIAWAVFSLKGSPAGDGKEKGGKPTGRAGNETVLEREPVAPKEPILTDKERKEVKKEYVAATEKCQELHHEQNESDPAITEIELVEPEGPPDDSNSISSDDHRSIPPQAEPQVHTEREKGGDKEATPLLTTASSQEELEMKINEATEDVVVEQDQSEGWVML